MHLPSSLHQCVLSFNLDAHILDFHPSHSSASPLPPALLLSFVPFYTDFPSLSATPHPPIPGPAGTVCYAREEFAQLLLLSEDVAGKKSSRFPYAVSYPWTRDMEEDGEQTGET